MPIQLTTDYSATHLRAVARSSKQAQSPHRSENGQLGEHNVPNGWLIVSRRWQYD